MTHPQPPFGNAEQPPAAPGTYGGYGPVPEPGSGALAYPQSTRSGIYPGQHSPLPRQYKDNTVAWLLWFFLGYFGAHHFYLDRTKRGVAYLVTWGLSALLSLVVIGFLGFIALFVLWLVDAFQLSNRVRQYNADAFAANRAVGLA